MMMTTEMDIETSVYYVHLTRLIAREDFIKFTRRESTKTYITFALLTEWQREPLVKLVKIAPSALITAGINFVTWRMKQEIESYDVICT
jgi:hypothetical protein